jgi:hypothetical protein
MRYSPPMTMRCIFDPSIGILINRTFPMRYNELTAGFRLGAQPNRSPDSVADSSFQSRR